MNKPDYESLMREWFQNKENIQQLRIDRAIFNRENKCTKKWDIPGDYGDIWRDASCIDAAEDNKLRHEEEPFDINQMCTTCLRRHCFHLAIMKLAHRNSAIMTIIKRAVRKIKGNDHA